MLAPTPVLISRRACPPAGYLAWRRFCGLAPDLRDIPRPLRRELLNLYEHIEDIDLFVGGQLETPWPGDLTGPVFSCLNGEQFERLRFSDRFWHEERRNGFTRGEFR